MTLREQIQKIYRGADQSSGGVHVLKVYENTDGTVTYLTSECQMRYFKNGRANMHTKIEYSVVYRARCIHGVWIETPVDLYSPENRSRYRIRTKKQAMEYFKEVTKGLK